MNLKHFRSPILRALVALGVVFGASPRVNACEVTVSGTSILVRGGTLGGNGAWLEVKNAIRADGSMGENYKLAESVWSEMGCYGY